MFRFRGSSSASKTSKLRCNSITDSTRSICSISGASSLVVLAVLAAPEALARLAANRGVRWLQVSSVYKLPDGPGRHLACVEVKG